MQLRGYSCGFTYIASYIELEISGSILFFFLSKTSLRDHVCMARDALYNDIHYANTISAIYSV